MSPATLMHGAELQMLLSTLREAIVLKQVTIYTFKYLPTVTKEKFIEQIGDVEYIIEFVVRQTS